MIKTIEKEKYSERELEDLARDVYDETVNVLGMEMDALRIIKQLDEPFYTELLEGLQEQITVYVCSECDEEYDDESDAEDCHPDDEEEDDE